MLKTHSFDPCFSVYSIIIRYTLKTNFHIYVCNETEILIDAIFSTGRRGNCYSDKYLSTPSVENVVKMTIFMIQRGFILLSMYVRHWYSFVGWSGRPVGKSIILMQQLLNLSLSGLRQGRVTDESFNGGCLTENIQ